MTPDSGNTNPREPRTPLPSVNSLALAIRVTIAGRCRGGEWRGSRRGDAGLVEGAHVSSATRSDTVIRSCRRRCSPPRVDHEQFDTEHGYLLREEVQGGVMRSGLVGGVAGIWLGGRHATAAVLR